jgi:hypothetical protein
MKNSQRIVNVMRQAIEQETRSGAKMHHTPAVIEEVGPSTEPLLRGVSLLLATRSGDTETTGGLIASAYIRGDELIEDIIIPAGAYVSAGDYVSLAMTDGGKAWIDRVIPSSIYSKMVLDYNRATIGVGTGVTGTWDWGEPGQVLVSAGPDAPMYYADVDGISAGPEIPTVIFYSSGGDDAPALNALIAEVEHGTNIILADKLYLLGSEITVNKSNISIVGRGIGNVTHDSTVLRRTVGSSGAVLKWASSPPPYGGNPADVEGGFLSGVTLEANNLAEYALQVLGVSAVIAEQCWFVNGTTAQVFLTTHPYEGVDAYNSHEGIALRDCLLYASGSQKGLLIGGVDGSSNAVYGCVFENINIVHENGSAVHIEHGDSFEFLGLRIATSGGGTGNTVELGPPVNAVRFFGGFQMVGGDIVIRASNSTFGSLQSIALGLSTVDSTRQPIIEQGAQYHFINDRGFMTTVPDPRSHAVWRDDFHGGLGTSGTLGELGWGSIGGTQSVLSGEIDHPGIIRLETTGASGTLGGIVLPYGGGAGIFHPDENWWLDAFIFRMNEIDSNAKARVGLCVAGQSGSDPPSGGLYLEKLGTDTNWFAVMRSGGSEARHNTGQAAVGAAWLKLGMHSLSGGGIGFYLGNVLNMNATVNQAGPVPTTSLMPFAQIKNAAAANKTLDVDLFQMHIVGMER